MRTLCLVAALCVSTPVWAHIKLTSPTSFQVTDFLGGPQKEAPCGGAGTPSGVVTTVEAGSQLTVTWVESIFHPGHFRIGIAQRDSDFVTPAATVTGNNCESASIEAPVAYPTLVDGLFPHTTGVLGGTHTTTITVPQMTCENCMLQVVQFMASHPPPCFYFQCAALRIVMPQGSDGGVQPDAGVAPDAGPGTSDMVSSPGCGCSASPVTASLWLLGVSGLWAARRRRR